MPRGYPVASRSALRPPVGRRKSLLSGPPRRKMPPVRSEAQDRPDREATQGLRLNRFSSGILAACFPQAPNRGSSRHLDRGRRAAQWNPRVFSAPAGRGAFLRLNEKRNRGHAAAIRARQYLRTDLSTSPACSSDNQDSMRVHGRTLSLFRIFELHGDDIGGRVAIFPADRAEHMIERIGRPSLNFCVDRSGP